MSDLKNIPEQVVNDTSIVITNVDAKCCEMSPGKGNYKVLLTFTTAEGVVKDQIMMSVQSLYNLMRTT